MPKSRHRLHILTTITMPPCNRGREDNMATREASWDEDRAQARQRQNRDHTIMLLAGMALVLLLSAYVLLSWPGLLIAAAATALLLVAAPQVPVEAIMQLYRAVPIDARGSSQIYRIRDFLVERAGVPAPPDLYVVPSMALNAFSVGTPPSPKGCYASSIWRSLPACSPTNWPISATTICS
jgi:Zn-dependent protease with chaperone function